MTRRSLIPFAALVLMAAAPPVQPRESAPPAPPPPPRSVEEQRRFDARKAVEDARSAGFGALIQHGERTLNAAGFVGDFGWAYAPATGDSDGTSFSWSTDPKRRLNSSKDLWPWASVTKQVVAVLVMQEVAKGTVALDAPVSRYLPNFTSANAAKLTVRQLLRHQSGLPDPSAIRDARGQEGGFYLAANRARRVPYATLCAGPVTGPPGGRWTYNNCDFMIAGDLLKAVTGKDWRTLARERIAGELYLDSVGTFPTTATVKADPTIDFDSFEAAGAMFGTVSDLLRFDRLLLRGKVLPREALAEMWDGRPELGSIALGQWAFDTPLKGCAAPVRIIERRGGIGNVQVRNFLFPANGTAFALFTDRPDYEFGEVWQGKGLSYELASLAACGKPK